ncbi:MAG TPA: PDZ domain-containing protein [Pyrinomonadaceae bacterium]|nr:PDZ domain-containing protein [Pyrinomonadaceae bacterium]
MIKSRLVATVSALLLCLCCYAQAAAQARGARPQVEYTVRVESPFEQVYRATTVVKNVNAPRLRLELPVFRPGIYTTNFFVTNIFDISAADGAGKPLTFVMPRKQTWEIETGGAPEVRFSYSYRAEVLSASQAYLDQDFGFFTGVHFFPMVQSRRDLPAAVRFEAPAGWAVLSTLKETADPAAYTAADYDSLADSQTMVGHFDLTRFEVDGQPRYFASTPAGKYSKERTAEMIEILTRVERVQAAIFGERPFDKYLYFYIFKQRVEGPGPNTLPEIQSMNSHLHIVRPNDEDSEPARLLASANHNLFHAWNLMRMRPAEYWPLDYSREVETPLLWLAEGVTRYYMTITRLRARYGTREDFMMRLSEAIADVERRPARAYLSPANASVLSAVRYEGTLEADYSFVMGGHVVGALLDLSIRRDTAGRASFDDVMRLLYQQSYKKGRGYTADDVVRIINQLTGRDYRDFFRRYVSGTEVPPYDEILGYAGYRLEKIVNERPSLGVALGQGPGGVTLTNVVRRSPAARAGLEAGDVLLKLGDLDVAKDGVAGVRELVTSRKGQTVPVTVRRGEQVRQAELLIGVTRDVDFRVREVPDPTPEQLRLRDAWLKQ